MRWLTLTFALTVALTLPVVAPGTAQAQTDSGSDAEARRLFEAGRAAYEAENFDEAIRNFRRAYVFSPRFPLLYNIGQAELRAGHDAQALEAFEGFLRQAPADDARRSEVDERVRVLRAMGVTAATGTVTTGGSSTTTATAEPTPEPEPTVEPAVEPAAASTTEPVPTSPSAPSGGGGGPGAAPWILVGGGAAVAVVGAILMGVGASDASAAGSVADGTTLADFQSRVSAANTEWGVGIALVGVGVVAAGVGIAWAVAGGGGSSEASPASARLRVTPVGLALEGTF